MIDGLVSRSIKMLSTFEFWLELNTKCKGKTLLGLVNFLFCFQFNIKLIQSKTWFSVALPNRRKNSNSFALPDLDKIPPRPFYWTSLSFGLYSLSWNSIKLSTWTDNCHKCKILEMCGHSIQFCQIIHDIHRFCSNLFGNFHPLHVW